MGMSYYNVADISVGLIKSHAYNQADMEWRIYTFRISVEIIS